MKIVYLRHAIVMYGGIERIFTDKMNWLAENTAHEIHLVTWEQCGNPTSYTLSPKVTHHDVDVNTFLIYKQHPLTRLFTTQKYKKELLSKIQKYIDDIVPDIIISVAFEASDIFYQLKTNAIKVVESHCVKNHAVKRETLNYSLLKDIKDTIKYQKDSRRIEKNVDCIVCLTKGDAKLWNHPCVKVIPNMIDLSNLTVENCSNKKVIAVGRMVYQKGYDKLILLWKRIHQKHPDWTLAIYGDGLACASIQSLIQQQGLQNTITLYPSTDDIFSKYAQSSIFVFPSRYEGFGLTLCEAMSCGLPAVSFDCPYGPREIITDGEDGFLVPLGDCEKFAEKISYLIEHPEERRRMGQNGIESAQRFSADKIMPQWVELFESLTPKN